MEEPNTPEAVPVADPSATAAETPTTPVETADQSSATVQTADQSSAPKQKADQSSTAQIIIAVVVVAILALLLRKLCGKKKDADTDTSSSQAKDNGKAVEIYVGNLSYAMTDDQLRKEFERFGVVKSARVIGHRSSGKSKGYGFVEMPHRKEAEIAIKNLHNREVMGRKLRVNEARHGVPKP